MGTIAKFERLADPKATSSLCSPFVASLEDKGLDPMSSDIKLTSRYLHVITSIMFHEQAQGPHRNNVG